MANRMTGKRSPWPTFVACCLGTALPAPAWAAGANAAQKAAAESLFDDGLRAMKSGHYAEACPKLEESERIDPGIGTLLYLGDCYEKTGRTASAWATFREAASAAQAQGETDRARVAAARADRLQPSLSRLTLKVAPETAQLGSLRVMRDNVPVANTLFGIAIPVDPGKYHIVASADGYHSFEVDLEVLTTGDNKTLEIPALRPAAAAPASPAPVATASSTLAQSNAGPAPLPAPVPDAPSPANGMRYAAYITGALGVVGLGVGSYFGVKAISKNSDAERFCPRGNRCDDPSGERLTNDAKHAAVAANVAIGVGAAFVIAGVVLYLTHDSAKKAGRIDLHPLVSRDLAGIGLGGGFQ